MNDYKFNRRVVSRYLGDDVYKSNHNLPEDLARKMADLMQEAHQFLSAQTQERCESLVEEWPEFASLARTYGELNPNLRECTIKISRSLATVNATRVQNISEWAVDVAIDEMYDENDKAAVRAIPSIAKVIQAREEDKVIDEEAKAFYDKHYPSETALVDTTADDPEDETYSWRV